MAKIPASELIVNSRGAIYHLNCRPEEISNNILIVGDPDRVKEISKHFDKIEYKTQNFKRFRKFSQCLKKLTTSSE